MGARHGGDGNVGGRGHAVGQGRQVVVLLQHPVLVCVDEYARRVVVEPEQAVPELLPRAEGLAGPDPHARRQSYCQRHEVLEQQHHMQRLEVFLVQLVTAGTHDALYVLTVHIGLVDEAANHYRRGQCGQNAEDTNADHELLQLVCLGAVLYAPLVLDHIADAEQRDEASEQEDDAQHQVDDQGEHHEVLEVVDVVVAHVADASDGIPVHSAHDDDADTLDSRDEPGSQVEVEGVGGDGLVAPLEPRSQEPSEAQDHPPDVRGHAKEVDQQEHERAGGGA